MFTIFAPVTSTFNSGVSIIRISGEKTLECLKSLGLKTIPQHQKIIFHKIFDPENSELIDEALISFFKSPQSFTGEDVAEINIHGSSFIAKKIFQILSKIKNVRFAEAGEFSKRAFLNGKLDLVQAEAIPDLIAAETSVQHKQAIRQLEGNLGRIYENWREKLIEISAKLEAFIDFPDEDLPTDIVTKLELDVKNLREEISSHLDDKNLGQKIKDGLSLVIIGSPNVGKSSLINFLSQSEVAIVSDIAGTTRDIIETNLSIAGLPVKIFDTAGIRETSDKIEQEGVRRALKKASEADLKIFMLDAKNQTIREEDRKIIDQNTILVMNKIDLFDSKIDAKCNFKCDLEISLTSKINTSQLIKKLEEKILEIFPAINSTTNYSLITQERYRVILKNAFQNLTRFSLQKNIELAAEDIRMAVREVGKITGKVDIDNVLDVIFTRFCIGK